MTMTTIFRRICVPFALACITVVAQGASAAQPSLEDFAAPSFMESPELSPNGELIAGALTMQGKQYFGVLSSAQGTEVKRLVGVPEATALEDWTWVNDEWLLLRVSSTIKFETEDIRIRRGFGFSAKSGKLVPIARDKAGQDGANLLWTARDGTPRVLLSIQQSIYGDYETYWPEVFEVDVSTGGMQSRAKPNRGVMHWYADRHGQVRIGIGYNDMQRTSRLLYRKRNGELFRTIDRASKKEGESLLAPALFFDDESKALAFSDKSGFDALYELDLNTMELGKEVYSVPGYDIDFVRMDVQDGGLLGVGYTDTRFRTEWLQPDLARMQRQLEKVAGNNFNVHIESLSHDRQKALVRMDSASAPGTYRLLDQTNRSLMPVAFVNSRLKDAVLAPVRSIRYKARDGLELEAVLTLPKDKPSKNLPLIMMPHGGPGSRDAESWDWWAQYLASMGYAIVQPNYRGSTGYGDAFYEKGDGQWGMAMQDDLLDAIDHLAKQGIADAKRVCIVGASYGGYAALRGAQRDGAHYRCAVSYAGVADLPGISRYDSQFLNAGRSRDYWKARADNMKSVSPINFAEQFSIPVLLVHGKKDLRVPVQQSREMAERLTKAGKAVRYVEQADADHHFSRTADRVQFLQELTGFLREHNPPD
jgi:dienelactone hydrolase